MVLSECSCRFHIDDSRRADATDSGMVGVACSCRGCSGRERLGDGIRVCYGAVLLVGKQRLVLRKSKRVSCIIVVVVVIVIVVVVVVTTYASSSSPWSRRRHHGISIGVVCAFPKFM